jgi:D-amino peptidase
MMMQGVETGVFTGALLLGYHASAGHHGGVLSHTSGGTASSELRINGVVASEAMISAAIAGHFDVPVLMASGDNVAMEEIGQTLKDAETVIVKTVYSTQSALTLTPAVAHDRVREGVRRALARAGSMRPYKIERPVLDIVFRNRLPAEYLSYLRGIERSDGYTIRYRGEDMVDISRFIQFVLGYHSRLTF